MKESGKSLIMLQSEKKPSTLPLGIFWMWPLGVTASSTLKILQKVPMSGLERVQ